MQAGTRYRSGNGYRYLTSEIKILFRIHSTGFCSRTHMAQSGKSL